MRSCFFVLLFIGMLSSSALANEPIAQMTFKVVDDFGNVITGAPVIVSTFLHWVPGSEAGRNEYEKMNGVTDTNGLVVLSIPSKTGSIRYSVLAEGTYFENMNKMKFDDNVYYRDNGGTFIFTNQISDKWQPWNPIIDLVVKPVINPVPVYALAYGTDWQQHKVPEYNKPIGFDLMKGDWLPPYGDGVTADFIMTLKCNLGGLTSSRYQIFDATLMIDFPNDGDGIQSVYSNPREGSVLRLARYAPETGYETNWTMTTYKHEDEGLHEIREDQNYIFRVRTKKDETGNFTSALYGKIYGMIDYEIRPTGNHLQFMYYLNPTPNDRNLEFDPSQNHLKNLSTIERPKEP
ncbi:MAG: hypothetical protein EOM20_01565 [Spartobacteria bacterium]|nr:hypothetical protein [Spartobacteria bacterium]